MFLMPLLLASGFDWSSAFRQAALRAVLGCENTASGFEDSAGTDEGSIRTAKCYPHPYTPRPKYGLSKLRTAPSVLHTYTRIPMHAQSLSLSLFLSLALSLSLSLFLSLSLSLALFQTMHTNIHAYIHACMHAFIYVHTYVYTYIPTYMYVSMYSDSIQIHIYIYIYMYVLTYVCKIVYTHLYRETWSLHGLRSTGPASMHTLSKKTRLRPIFTRESSS